MLFQYIYFLNKGNIGIHLKSYLPFYLEAQEEAFGYLLDGSTFQYADQLITKLINSWIYW